MIAANALLQLPGIWSITQQLFIVVGFNHQGTTTLQTVSHQARSDAKGQWPYLSCPARQRN